MRFPSNKTLAKIAVYSAVAGLSAIMLMRKSMQDRIRNADYYKLALHELRKHKGAVNLLGEPIKEMGFDFANQYNSCDGETAHFEVSVKGSVERGKLLFWAIRDLKSGWSIDRLELELKSQPDKRFLIKKSDFQKEENSTKGNIFNADTI